MERAAYAWLISRFVDQKAEILFAKEEDLDDLIKETAAIPFDIEGVEFASGDEVSAFDAILKAYRFSNPALLDMADHVRSAKLDDIKNSFKKVGLEDSIPKLDAVCATDHELLEKAISLYDSFYLTFQKEKLKEGSVHHIDITRAL